MEINNVNKCAQCRHGFICKYLYDRALVMNALLKDETIKNLADQSLFSLDFVCKKYERDYSKRDISDPEPSNVRPILPDENEYECVYNEKTGSLSYVKKKKNNNDEEYPF